MEAVIGSLPNLTGEIRESKRVEARRKMRTNVNAISEMVPSDWLTYRIAREKFDTGEGVGFTTIGEAYLNFGVFGVVAFFGGLGFLLGRLDAINLLAHPKWIIFSTAILWPLMRTVRDDFANFVKPAVFVLIILLIWRVITIIFFPKHRF